MKHSTLYILGLFCLTLAFSNCKPECEVVIPTFGQSLDALNGTWKLQSVTQTDLITKESPKPKKDITKTLTDNQPATIRFDKSNMSYTMQGTFKKNYLMGMTGTFKFDNQDFPSAIKFTGSTSAADTLTSMLQSAMRPEYTSTSVLTLTRTKMKAGKKAINYTYQFVKQN